LEPGSCCAGVCRPGKLSANPALWPSIESALADSEFFVLLASPEATASEWVNREIAWWLHHRSVQTLLIIVLRGEIKWDKVAGNDFDWEQTTALSPSLRGAFPAEPFRLDLTWAQSSDELSLTNPSFADLVATLASALHGRPKDELIGEDVRQARRSRRMTRFAITLLSVLLIASMIASYVAVKMATAARSSEAAERKQREIAESERDHTEIARRHYLGIQAMRVAL